MILNSASRAAIHARSAALFFCSLMLFGGTPSVGRADEVLTNASSVLSLPAKIAAAGVPVSVQGVVTAAEANWSGRFFMEDASGGVFVESRSKEQPVPGDVVEVSGITRAGGYAPCITKPHWKKVGTAPLPEAKPVTIDQLMSGTEDSQRVSIQGVIRTAWMSGDRLGVELASGGYRLRAFVPSPPNLDPVTLVGAQVILQGTAAAAYNAPLRHIVTVTLFMPQMTDLHVQEMAPANPFDEPLTALDGIAQYRQNRSPANQVHVKGIVIYQRPGVDLFLQDASGGLQVKTPIAGTLIPGETVEAVGFPAVENYLPVLEDANVRPTTEPHVNVAPHAVSVADLQKGLHHAELITLQGRLIDRLVRGVGQVANVPVVQTTLVLQTTNFVFLAEKDTVDQNSLLTAIPMGSLLEVSGICLLDSGDDGKIKSLRLLLPASYNIHILQRPGWLTPEHLLESLAVVFTILLVAVGWTVMVSKRNIILKSLVREKEAAQTELQHAHDQLEERVKERTAQLKVEMTARKESELQFRAVLTERTRLAQELHDTLEQTMTGIALQLDMVSTQFQKKPDNALHHLKLARSLMRQSRVDLRQSVWGLRIRTEEQFNLVNALTLSIQQLTNGTGILVHVETSGDSRTLSEIVEENLLRIGQEAVTNAIKHSGAPTLKLELQYQPDAVVMQIQDNGRGFAPDTCVGPRDGHFGLLGIRERTERLGGRVVITSSPGNGTVVRVEIPTRPSNEAPPALISVEEHEPRA